MTLPRDCRTCKYGTIVAGSNEARPCAHCYGYPDHDKWEPRTTRVQQLEAENARLRRALAEWGGERAVLDALRAPEGIE